MNDRSNSNSLTRYDEIFSLAVRKLVEQPDALNVVVVYAANGSYITAPLCDSAEDDFERRITEQSDMIIAALKEQGSPVVLDILTLFRGNLNEIPSFALRKALIGQSMENAHAMILLGPSVARTIESTM